MKKLTDYHTPPIHLTKKLSKVRTNNQGEKTVLISAVNQDITELRKSVSSTDVAEILNTAGKQNTANQSDHQTNRIETRMITVSSD